MKRIFLLAGACAFLAAPTFAQMPASPPTGAPSQATPTPPPAAQIPSTEDFVKKVAISDMFEIQSSKLALSKKMKADRSFAQRMIHDHGETSAQLKKLVKSGKVKAELPTALDDEHQKMLDKLRGEQGVDFQKDYDQMQLQGHQDAVAMFQAYAQNGDNAELKSWAAKTLPHLQQHLAMAQKMS